MTDKEKIRAEIERQKKENYYDIYDEYDGFVRNAFESILSFIDSMQEEPVSEDLEEAAKTYAKKKSRLENSSYDNVIIIIGICCSSKFQDGTTRARQKYGLDRKDGIPYKLSVRHPLPRKRNRYTRRGRGGILDCKTVQRRRTHPP